ncbi:unnamed protein product [Urochloa humidicola]
MGMMAAVKVEEHEGSVWNWQNLVASSLSPSISEAGSDGGGMRMLPVAADLVSDSRRTSGPVRRAMGGWTPEEDEKLWKAVDACKKGRTQCRRLPHYAGSGEGSGCL